MKRIIFYYFLSTTCYTVILDAKSNVEYPFTDFNVPIYNNCCRENLSKDPLLKRVTYNFSINIKYPAAELIDYYVSHFETNGWKKNLDRIKGGKWSNYVIYSKKGPTLVSQWTGIWSDIKYPRDLIFVLKYYDLSDIRPDKLYVTIQVYKRVTVFYNNTHIIDTRPNIK